MILIPFVLGSNMIEKITIVCIVVVVCTAFVKSRLDYCKKMGISYKCKKIKKHGMKRSKYRNWGNKMSQDGKGGRSANS